MENDSPFADQPKRRRGRPRKHAVNGNGAHAPEAAGDAALAVLERPRIDVDALRAKQALRIQLFTDSLGEGRRLPDAERGLIIRVLEWYATPYEWREPKTEIGLAEQLGVTPLKLRVLQSMYRDGIEAALDEVRGAAKIHGKLRFIEAFDGMIDAASAGNAPAFDRVTAEAFGDELPGVNVNVGVQVNVEDLRARLMEKLG